MYCTEGRQYGGMRRDDQSDDLGLHRHFIVDKQPLLDMDAPPLPLQFGCSRPFDVSVA